MVSGRVVYTLNVKAPSKSPPKGETCEASAFLGTDGSLESVSLIFFVTAFAFFFTSSFVKRSSVKPFSFKKTVLASSYIFASALL